jgi:hypothetical protein
LLFFAASFVDDQRIYTLTRTLTYKYVDVNGNFKIDRGQRINRESISGRAASRALEEARTQAGANHSVGRNGFLDAEFR